MLLDAMLRGLLYQALIQCPELIPSICASRFNDPGQSNIRSKISIGGTSELVDSFTKLVNQKAGHLNFCFFIDGLGEYAKDHFEIVQMFQKIPMAEHAKVVISSRPRAALEAGSYYFKTSHEPTLPSTLTIN
jgi:hypothetical protein